MLSQRDPPRSPAPRFSLTGCADGNLAHFRHDVPDDVAAAVQALLRTEPPLCARDSLPVHLAHYLALFDATSTEPDVEFSYDLPHATGFPPDVRIVASGTPEGDALLSGYERDGVTAGLHEIGFKDTGEFWAPWCVAFDGREPAAVAFAARLGEHGAATGVATAKAHRGRGLAAAAVAAWSSHPALTDKTLGYSHNRDNRSSQRVTERLGLRFIGTQFRIA
jgi:RimJ/RimL family protein N-acetyltransferase